MINTTNATSPTTMPSAYWRTRPVLHAADRATGRAEAPGDPVDRAVDDLRVEDVRQPLRAATDRPADGGCDSFVVVPGVPEETAEPTELLVTGIDRRVLETAAIDEIRAGDPDADR